MVGKKSNISITDTHVKMLILKMSNWESLSLDRTYHGTKSEPTMETTKNHNS